MLGFWCFRCGAAAGGTVPQRPYRGRHQFWSKARNVDSARVKRGEVKAHSMRWQQRMVENTYPVQLRFGEG